MTNLIINTGKPPQNKNYKSQNKTENFVINTRYPPQKNKIKSHIVKNTTCHKYKLTSTKQTIQTTKQNKIKNLVINTG